MLEIRKENRLLRLTLNRPEKRNALNLPLCQALVDALTQADADPSIGAILLTGNGKAFCAGMDLHEAVEVDRTRLDAVHERLFTAGHRLRKPLIAGVHGAALAGGTGLAANAHILVAGPDATFGLTEIRIALWPILIFRAVKAAVGERRATELSLTGRTFSGDEAHTYGLVHEVSTSPEARAAEIALQVAGYSPAAVTAGLEYVARTRDTSWEESGRIGAEIRRRLIESLEFRQSAARLLAGTARKQEP